MIFLSRTSSWCFPSRTHAHSLVRVNSKPFASHRGRFERGGVRECAWWLVRPAAVRERPFDGAAEELKAAAAGEDGASEKFMTDRRHLHHVNTTDKMFLSAPRRKQSAFMADTEQKTGRRNYPAIGAGISEPFEAAVAPEVMFLPETKPVRMPAHALESALCAQGAKVEKKTRSRLAPGEIRPGTKFLHQKKKKKSNLNFARMKWWYLLNATLNNARKTLINGASKAFLIKTWKDLSN